jgi:hypothetical protein
MRCGSRETIHEKKKRELFLHEMRNSHGAMTRRRHQLDKE